MKRLKLLVTTLVLLSVLAAPFAGTATAFVADIRGALSEGVRSPSSTPTLSLWERGDEGNIERGERVIEAQVSKEESDKVRIVDVNVTPGVVEPIEVLTLNTTMYNESERADGLVVELTVTAPNGEMVQNMRQRNVGVDPSDDMAVYWVWRIPERLDDGTYSVQATVYEPDGSTVIDREQEVEAFAVRKVDREGARAN